MEFEMAYDLPLEVDREVVFVVADDRHRKVRLHLSAVELDGDSVKFTGASLGSSVKDIKAAKRDEPPVVVTGDVRLVDGVWRGSLAKG